MGHYTANLRDIEFALFDLLGREKILGTGPFADIDRDTAMGMLEELKRLAENDLAASFIDGDRLGTNFDKATGEVTLPESFKKSYKTFMDNGWGLIDVPAALGGTVIPPSVRWAIAEMVLGSNPAIHIYASGTAFSHVLYELGTPEQKKWAQLMVDKGWTATMMLTEPEAGSDVGAGRSKAIKQPDGSWHITGTKRFITSGDSDLSDNIMHYVLARPEGERPGTKGLSLFLVPKYHFNPETGELGKRNGIYVTNVEKKMGLNVSSTCEMTMGEKEPCVGWQLGEVHDGIAQMFKIIEFARMMVGTKAISTLSAGYMHALAYAKSRVQGPDLTLQTQKDSPRVEIIKHPDVRRSLMTQKAYAEGMRALVLYTASLQDDIAIAEAAGEDASMLIAMNDLMLPIVKGFGSERAWVLLGTESLQTFGGSGFTQDWPLEQYVRDAKIDTLYEGTTAIQGLDFFFRKIVKNNGQALQTIAMDIATFVKGDNGTGFLANERVALGKALDDVQTIVGTLIGHAMASQSEVKEIYKVGLSTSRLLLSTGDLICGYLLLREAEIANEKMASASEKDKLFYEGKIAAAKFYATNILPTITASRKIVENTDGALMDVPEGAF